MPLTTHVTTRLGTKRLVELTNPPGVGAAQPTTVDAARLGFAADDAAAYLEVKAGVAYDDTSARHISVAVEVVVYFLMLRAGANVEALSRVKGRVDEDLEALRLVTGNDRIIPLSTSELEPTTDTEEQGSPARPYFDPRQLDRMQLNDPGSSSISTGRSGT